LNQYKYPIYFVNFDEIVKTQNWDGKVKSRHPVEKRGPGVS